MMKVISAYGFSAVAFLVIDAVWLTLVGPKLYRPILGDLLAEKVNFTAAVAFYLIYVMEGGGDQRRHPRLCGLCDL